MRYLSLLSLFCVFICCKEASSSKETPMGFVQNKTEDLEVILPKSEALIRHKHYVLSYNEAHEQANWVAYTLAKKDIVYSHLKRPYFIDDPLVSSGSANWKNYIRSGYDRGHLCPAGDRRFSVEAFNETFYTSNVTPQRNDFNSGVWNRLEQKTRYWAKKYDGLLVITGGVLQGNLETIGREKVSVPKYFYKILVDYRHGKYHAIGFLLPHKDSEQPLYSFVTSIDTIEQMTGIDFMPKLPDAFENKLETNVDYKAWSF